LGILFDLQPENTTWDNINSNAQRERCDSDTQNSDSSAKHDSREATRQQAQSSHTKEGQQKVGKTRIQWWGKAAMKTARRVQERVRVQETVTR